MSRNKQHNHGQQTHTDTKTQQKLAHVQVTSVTNHLTTSLTFTAAHPSNPSRKVFTLINNEDNNNTTPAPLIPFTLEKLVLNKTTIVECA